MPWVVLALWAESAALHAGSGLGHWINTHSTFPTAQVMLGPYKQHFHRTTGTQTSHSTRVFGKQGLANPVTNKMSIPHGHPSRPPQQ